MADSEPDTPSERGLEELCESIAEQYYGKPYFIENGVRIWHSITAEVEYTLLVTLLKTIFEEQIAKVFEDFARKYELS